MKQTVHRFTNHRNAVFYVVIYLIVLQIWRYFNTQIQEKGQFDKVQIGVFL